MDLKEEDILGEKIHEHWYYISKGRAMRAFLEDYSCDEVLDVGAGSGIFARQLLDQGFCNSAVCVDPFYDEEKEELQNGKPISFVKSINKTTQNLILMMDVLEHVEDDVGLLSQYTSTMPQGGRVLITVPAFQFMWSGHDVFLEHYRRYTIQSMEEVIKKAGMTPVKSRYFFGSLFPVVAVIRSFKNVMRGQKPEVAKSELKLYSNWLNKTLTAIHDAERQSLFTFNKLFGLSVFCLCEKR
ncbi:MAG: methyltransferase domain-containing protein [Alphaproteobacteria bacterium]|nr:methyltransferase domain-containing protein [Alphaproteobacteria bacterium]